MKLDRYDRAILRLLQQDARITNTRLADEVSLSESACLRRVRSLEESGLIQGYTALIAPSANRSRTRLGIRNATMNASISLPAPKSAART